MDTKLAIVGMGTALFLGAGISMAVAAEPRVDEAAARPAVAADALDVDAMAQMHGSMDPAAMDRLHAEMRDEMPAELREECDEMHAAMGADGMAGGGMMGDGAAHQRHHAEQAR